MTKGYDINFKNWIYLTYEIVFVSMLTTTEQYFMVWTCHKLTHTADGHLFPSNSAEENPQSCSIYTGTLDKILILIGTALFLNF